MVGDLAFAAFKSNSAFNGVTILPNSSDVPTEVRQRAAKRLAELTGESVLPIPRKIAEIAVKHIPQFVREFTNLPDRVSGLGLPKERFTQLQNGLADALLADGSDAPMIFGSEESQLFDNLVWARKLAKALDHGAGETLQDISSIVEDAQRVAAQGVLTDLPEALQEAGAETLAAVRGGNFFEDLPDLGHTLETLQQIVSKRCGEEVDGMRSGFEAQVVSFRKSSDYEALDSGEQLTTDQNLGDLVFDCQPTLTGLQAASSTLNRLNNQLQAIRVSVQESVNSLAPKVRRKRPNTTSTLNPDPQRLRRKP